MKLNGRGRETSLTQAAPDGCTGPRQISQPSTPGLFSSHLSVGTEIPGTSCLIELPLSDSSYLKRFHLGAFG